MSQFIALAGRIRNQYIMSLIIVIVYHSEMCILFTPILLTLLSQIKPQIHKVSIGNRVLASSVDSSLHGIIIKIAV